MTIKTILCPVDLSAFSKPALSHAAALAGWYDAEVIAFHVFATVMPSAALDTYPAWILQMPDARDNIARELNSLLEPYATMGISLRLHTAEGNPAGKIVEYASDVEADLIVMGTHGRSGFDRLTLGSVTEKVLRKAPCPVLTLPPGTASSDTAVDYRSILCPIDFSASSQLGLDFALSLARNNHANVTILHVIETVDEDPDQVRRRSETAAAALHAWLTTHVQPSDSVSEMITIGKPHQAILRAASECGADLIVIGVRGRGAIDLTLFGSTTNQVVRRALCPVITVRTRGEEL